MNQNYHCIKCDYTTDNNSNFHKHIRTKMHNRPDYEYYCPVCEENRGLTKQEHRSHMKTHCDRNRVATCLILLQHKIKQYNKMRRNQKVIATYAEIERHEEYYLKHRSKKGLNMREKSIEDPAKRAEKIAKVNALLESNKSITKRTNVDEALRLKYLEMLNDFGV
jgi:hypothetical protein